MIAKRNMILVFLMILMVIAVAIFAITLSFDLQLAGGFDSILGHCVGSACNTL